MIKSKSPSHQSRNSGLKDEAGGFLQKSKRIENRALLDRFQGLPCEICGTTYGTVGHHVTTKKAGGHDLPNNLMPLCQIHHREVHDRGRKTFFRKYEQAQEWAYSFERYDIMEEL